VLTKVLYPNWKLYLVLHFLVEIGRPCSTGATIKKMTSRKFETEARRALGPLPDKASIPKVGLHCYLITSTGQHHCQEFITLFIIRSACDNGESYIVIKDQYYLNKQYHDKNLAY